MKGSRFVFLAPSFYDGNATTASVSLSLYPGASSTCLCCEDVRHNKLNNNNGWK